MRPFLFLAFLLSACVPAVAPVPSPPPAGPPCEISGVLSGETHLSGEVVVVSDILVPKGSTLVVHPGTLVRIRPSESTKIDPEYLSPATEILVRGTLKVLGSAERPVRFLPDGKGGTEPSWAGIVLDRAEGSVLDHLKIDAAETGLLCIGASPEVRAAVVTGCRYGVIAQEGSAPRIFDSRIEKGEGGVFCWRRARPLLRGNRIAAHQEEGIFIDPTSAARLEENEITGNAIGVAFYPQTPSFDRAQVRGNGEDLRLLEGGAP